MGLFRKKKKSSEDKNTRIAKQSSEEGLDDFTHQVVSTAEGCVEHYKGKYGDALDFSVGSLVTIDTILDDSAGSLSRMEEAQQTWIISSVGSYIFEVARRNYGGKFYWHDQKNQPIFVTGQPDFEISIMAFEKVKGRLNNGKEDNIPYYFKGYTERVEKAKKGDRALII